MTDEKGRPKRLPKVMQLVFDDYLAGIAAGMYGIRLL